MLSMAVSGANAEKPHLRIGGWTMAIDLIGVLEDRRQKDGAARDAAMRRLERSSYLQLRHIRCHVRHGVLRLLGSVSSYYLRQIAQVTVQGLPGIDAIDNQLEVAGGKARGGEDWPD
jgi:hypothetical protein